jgi:hypothetical protein
MAAYTGTFNHTTLGYNTVNFAITEHVLAQALANSDTLALTIPAGYGANTYVPASIVCWSAANPRVPQTNYSMTSYDQDTGVLTLTASGAVADNSTFLVTWAPATVGS